MFFEDGKLKINPLFYSMPAVQESNLNVKLYLEMKLQCNRHGTEVLVVRLSGETI